MATCRHGGKHDILFDMGTYLNEGNRLYRQSVNSEIHVDKSLLIRETNKRLDTDDKYICLSRPRRFGKSMAAHMLMAYYSRGADSRELFSDKKIAADPSFETHLNKYNVIHLVRSRRRSPSIKSNAANIPRRSKTIPARSSSSASITRPMPKDPNTRSTRA